MKRYYAVLLSCLLGTSAFAGDGRHEISQSMIPYTITNAGSYVVTENLTGVTFFSGIVIDSDGVTLDLNGFSLTGIPSANHGIFVNGARNYITIRNGTIRDWPADGIDATSAQHGQIHDIQSIGNSKGVDLDNYWRLSNCMAVSNSSDGFEVDDSCILEHCVSSENGVMGIQAGDAARIMACTTVTNGSSGINLDADGVVKDCVSKGNGVSGFAALQRALITDSFASGNAITGFDILHDTLVERCTSSKNGLYGYDARGNRNTIRDCNASLNLSSGLILTEDSTAVGNLSVRNGDAGLTVSRFCTLENNQSMFNNIGINTLLTNNVVRNNIVQKNTNNYQLLPNNQYELLISEIPERIEVPAKATLTGTLYSPFTVQSGISIRSSDVEIDLNGHALVGDGASSTADGIGKTFTRTNIVIRNGIIRGWPDYGIWLDGCVNVRCENLQVSENGDSGMLLGPNAMVVNCQSITNAQDGISVGEGSTVSGSQAHRNNFDGIKAGVGSSVMGCSAHGNGSDGIEVAGSSVVSDCSAKDNGDDGIDGVSTATIRGCVADGNGGNGIETGTGSTVEGCHSSGSTGDGINAGAGSTIVNCASHSNDDDGIDVTGSSTVIDNSVYLNTGDGIETASGSTVMRNTCSGNGSAATNAGIHVVSGSADARIEDNTCRLNGVGIHVEGSDNLVVKNFCGSSSFTNYIISAGNDSAPIDDEPGFNFTNTTPWVNFSVQ